MDNNSVLILISVVALFLVLMLGMFGFLIYRLLKHQNQNNLSLSLPAEVDKSKLHPDVLERIKTVEKFRIKKTDLFCPVHPDEPGETNCAICDKLYCKTCIRPFKSLYFCKEHLPLVMRNDWEEVVTIKTSTIDPEHGVRLFDIKKVLLERDNLPTYVETHYKINLEQDHIETYLVLFGIKENLVTLKEKLEKI